MTQKTEEADFFLQGVQDSTPSDEATSNEVQDRAVCELGTHLEILKYLSNTHPLGLSFIWEVPAHMKTALPHETE